LSAALDLSRRAVVVDRAVCPCEPMTDDSFNRRLVAACLVTIEALDDLCGRDRR